MGNWRKLKKFTHGKEDDAFLYDAFYNKFKDRKWESVESGKKYDCHLGIDPKEARGNFMINDVNLEIPPTHITVHKEDMYWQWKTLRSKVATKIPSGRGVCQVSIDIVFTPDLLLHLHRLLVQFRQSPFVFCENMYLRESIVPNWPVTQLMAFTVIGCQVANMTGHPGSFIMSLDMRWFNYFPYTDNFFFRKEWKTWPTSFEEFVQADPESDEKVLGSTTKVHTIDWYGKDLKKIVGQLYNAKSPSQLKVDRFLGGDPQEAFEEPFSTKVKGGYTLKQLINTHVGQSFDLQPLPQRMEPSAPVPNPNLSNIYVRYINNLQVKALYDSFNLDMCKLIESYYTNTPGHGDAIVNSALKWEEFTAGPNGGCGIVRGLHTSSLPAGVRYAAIHHMLSYCNRVNFVFNQYITLGYNPKLVKKLKEGKQKILDEELKALMTEPKQNIYSHMVADHYRKNVDARSDLGKKWSDFNGDVDRKVLVAPEIMKRTIKDVEANETVANTTLRPWIHADSTLARIPTGSYDGWTTTGVWDVFPKTEGDMLEPMFHLKWYPPLLKGQIIEEYIHPVNGKGQNVLSHEKNDWTKPYSPEETKALIARGIETYGTQAHPYLRIGNVIEGEDSAWEGTPVFAVEAGVITEMRSETPPGNLIDAGGDFSQTVEGTDWHIEISHSGMAQEYLGDPSKAPKYKSTYKWLFKPHHELSKGSKVKRGQIIGYIGHTGNYINMARAQIKFQMYRNGFEIDPWNELTLPMDESAILCNTYDGIDWSLADKGWEICKTMGLNAPRNPRSSFDGNQVAHEKSNVEKFGDNQEHVGRNALYNLCLLAIYVDVIENAVRAKYPDRNTKMYVLSSYRNQRGSEHKAASKLHTEMTSQHARGRAVDLRFKNISVWEVYCVVIDLIAKKKIPQGGIGLYGFRYKERYDRTVKSKWEDFDMKDGVVELKDMPADTELNKKNFSGSYSFLHYDIRCNVGLRKPRGWVDIDEKASPEEQSKAKAAQNKALSYHMYGRWGGKGEKFRAERFPWMYDQAAHNAYEANKKDKAGHKNRNRSSWLEENEKPLWEAAGGKSSEWNRSGFGEVYTITTTEEDLSDKSDSDEQDTGDQEAPTDVPKMNQLKFKCPPDTKAPENPEKNEEADTKENKALEDLEPLDADEEESVSRTIGLMMANGWEYYEEDRTVNNVWKRNVRTVVGLQNYNIDGLGLPFNDKVLKEAIRGKLAPKHTHNIFVDHGLVATGVSGTLRNIVSTIPILDHEFPTMQHLGSVEPEFVLQFYGKDQQGIGGLGVGKEMEHMRALLQQNARSFRPIPDCYAMCTDTFITRLFGSFKDTDYQHAEGTALSRLGKRSIISSMGQSTLEGSPGSYTMTMKVQETNPYFSEEISRSATRSKKGKLPIMEVYKKVLKALETGHSSSAMKDLPEFSEFEKKELKRKKLRRIIDLYGQVYYSKEGLVDALEEKWFVNDNSAFMGNSSFQKNFSTLAFSSSGGANFPAQLGGPMAVDPDKNVWARRNPGVYGNNEAPGMIRDWYKKSGGSDQLGKDRAILLFRADMLSDGSAYVMPRKDTRQLSPSSQESLVPSGIDTVVVQTKNAFRAAIKDKAPDVSAYETGTGEIVGANLESIQNLLNEVLGTDRAAPIYAENAFIQGSYPKLDSEGRQVYQYQTELAPKSGAAIPQKDKPMVPAAIIDTRDSGTTGIIAIDISDYLREEGLSYNLKEVGPTGEHRLKDKTVAYASALQSIKRFVRFAMVDDTPELRTMGAWSSEMIKDELFDLDIGKHGFYSRILKWWWLYFINVVADENWGNDWGSWIAMGTTGVASNRNEIKAFFEDAKGRFLGGQVGYKAKGDIGHDDDEKLIDEAFRDSWMHNTAGGITALPTGYGGNPTGTSRWLHFFGRKIERANQFWWWHEDVESSHPEGGVAGFDAGAPTKRVTYKDDTKRLQYAEGYKQAYFDEMSEVNNLFALLLLRPHVGLASHIINNFLQPLTALTYPIQTTWNDSWWGAVQAYTLGDDSGQYQTATQFIAPGDKMGIYPQANVLSWWMTCPLRSPIDSSSHIIRAEGPLKVSQRFVTTFTNSAPEYDYVELTSGLDYTDNAFGSGKTATNTSNVYKKEGEDYIKVEPEEEGDDISWGEGEVRYKLTMKPGLKSPLSARNNGTLNWQQHFGKGEVAPVFANPAWEAQKMHYAKEFLTKLAETLLNDGEWLEANNLGELTGYGYESDLDNGMPCYPDMDLPDHPYYPSRMNATSPDFYFWNAYEDASMGVKKNMRDEIYRQASVYVKSTHEHLMKMNGQGIYNLEELLGKKALTIMAPQGLDKYKESTGGVSDGFDTSKGTRMQLSAMASQWEGAPEVLYNTWPGKDVSAASDAAQINTYKKNKGGNWEVYKVETSALPEWQPHTETEAGHIKSKGGVPTHMSAGGTTIPFDKDASSEKEADVDGEFKKEPVTTVAVPSIQGKIGKNKLGLEDKTAKLTEYNMRIKKSDKEKFEKLIEELQQEFQGKAAWDKKVKELRTLQVLTNAPDGGTSKKPSGDTRRLFPLSVTDFNPLYFGTQKADVDTYTEMLKKTRNIEAMFGSMAGYTGQTIKDKDDINTDTTATDVAMNDQFSNAFDVESLMRITKEASCDVTSQKMSMKRAFPTFRLFFVEEDEFESRWLNQDDFYSFNGVKEFSIHMSRKQPADTAVITLQNVSGTLDGTKRNVRADLDYIRTIEENEDAERGIGAAVQKGEYDLSTHGAGRIDKEFVPPQDIPFGSVVMRPGMNVQLRVGYSNDPAQLEVMLSGRVTDLAWSTHGDLCEVTVQSFGAELASILHGRTSLSGGNRFERGSGEVYPTTHHLLGSLMLSPELKHFGRWEFGDLRMIGETKDHTLDFYEYSKNVPLGLTMTHAFKNWCLNNIGALAVIAGGAQIAMMVPWHGGAGYAVSGTAKATAGQAAKGWLGTQYGKLLLRPVVGAPFRGAHWMGSGISAAGGAAARRIDASRLGFLMSAGGKVAGLASKGAAATWSAIANTPSFIGLGRAGAASRGILSEAVEAELKVLNAAFISGKISQEQFKRLLMGTGEAIEVMGARVAGEKGLLKPIMSESGQTLAQLTGGFAQGKKAKLWQFIADGSGLRASGQGWAGTTGGVAKKIFDDALIAASLNASGLAAKPMTTSAASKIIKSSVLIVRKSKKTFGRVKKGHTVNFGGKIYKGGETLPINALTSKGWVEASEAAIKAQTGMQEAMLIQAFQAAETAAMVNVRGVFAKFAPSLSGPLDQTFAKGLLQSNADDLAAATALTWKGGGAEAIKFAGKIPGTMMRIGAVGTAYAAVADTLVVNPIVKQYRIQMGQVKRTYNRAKAFYKLYPQDDNLFPPNPASYMRINLTLTEDIGGFISQMAGFAWYVFTLLDESAYVNAKKRVQGIWDSVWQTPGVILDKKIWYDHANYRVTNSTIWDVFHEMSLRHPGWVYGARPYGSKFEYRMFFGVPSQRYWSKPYANNFVKRLNYIRRQFSDDMQLNAVNKDIYRKLYGQGAYEELVFESELEMSVSLATVGKMATEDEYLTGADKKKQKELIAKVKERLIEPNKNVEWDEVLDNSLKMKMQSELLHEYMDALSHRFIPFRRYHYLSSSTDIIHNGIINSEHNVVNAVDVVYASPELDAHPEGSIQMKASSFIPDEMLKMDQIIYPNCRGYQSALRYGMGHLLHKMREMYRGEVLVLGNNRIRPWDIAIIMDNYNDMAGPIEVEAVVHHFSFETGFITEVKPNALVIGNEVSSLPIFEGIKLFAMAMEDLRSGKLGNSLGNLKKGQGFWEAMIKREQNQIPFTDGVKMGDIKEKVPSYIEMLFTDAEQLEEWNDYFTRRYGNVFRYGALQEAAEMYPHLGMGAFAEDNGLKTNFQKESNDSSDMADTALLNNIVENANSAARAPFKVVSALGLAGGAFLATTVLLAPFSRMFGAIPKGEMAKTTGTLSNLVTGIGMAATKHSRWIQGSAVGAGLFGGSYLAEQAIDNTLFRLEDYKKNNSYAWLIAAPVLFAKCMENETIIVVPLTKNGKPIVSGMNTQDPLMAWKNVMGQMRNMAAESITGAEEIVEEWQGYGSSIWQYVWDYKENGTL